VAAPEATSAECAVVAQTTTPRLQYNDQNIKIPLIREILLFDCEYKRLFISYFTQVRSGHFPGARRIVRTNDFLLRQMQFKIY
jgi:hypothetical protein